MSQYVTSTQFFERVGRVDPSATEITQVNALLTDASALVDLAALPVVINPADVTEDGTLASLIPIIVNMARRSWDNPRGLTQEQIGDYMWQAMGDVTSTKKEYRLIRRAVGRLGVGGIDQTNYMNINPYITRNDVEHDLLPEF